METANRLTGTGGGLARTSRPSAILPGLPSAPSSTSMGALFAREVEQATERIEAQASRTRRLDEQAHERRSTRKEGFGNSKQEELRDAPAPPEGMPPVEPRAPAPTPTDARDSRPGPAPKIEIASATPTPTESTAEGTESSPKASSSTDSNPVPVVPGPQGQPQGSVASTSTGQGAVAGAGRIDIHALEGVSARSAEAKSARPAAAASTSRAPDAEAVDRAQEILRQIKLHFSPGVRRLTLDLEPAELGRLAIQLTWRPGRISAIVRAGESQTLRLLEQSEAELRAILAERGIQADSIRFEMGFDGSATEGRTPNPGSHTRSHPRGTPPPAVPSTERLPTALESRTTSFFPDANVDTYA